MRRRAAANDVLDALAEARAVHGLVAVGLDRPDFVQRLVDVRADIADAILARPRETPHAPAEQDDRRHHERHAGENEQRELGAGQREHHETADEQQEVAHRHRQARADDGFEHRRVVGQPRDDFAGSRDLEEFRRQAQQVIEHCASQVRGDALAEPRDEVEPYVGGGGHEDDDAPEQHASARSSSAALPATNPRSITNRSPWPIASTAPAATSSAIAA